MSRVSMLSYAVRCSIRVIQVGSDDHAQTECTSQIAITQNSPLHKQ